MHPTIVAAMKKAQDIVENALEPVSEGREVLEAELQGLTKRQLIARCLENELPKKHVKINQVVFAILEEPDCAWLTWDMIAVIINKKVPESKTTADSLRWYPSDGAKKGKNIVPRKTSKEIQALLTEHMLK